MHQHLLLAYGESLITTDSADFDGTNDYMTRGAGLTGAANSKTGIISAWIRLDGGNGDSPRIIEASSAGNVVSLIRQTNNTFRIQGTNSSTSLILLLTSNTTYTASATWRHVLASWNLAAATGYLYINNVSDLAAGSILTNDTIDYTFPNWGIGAQTAGTNKLNGCLTEFYFAPGQFLDFSSIYNRRKFISASGKPVFLGTDGSIPTGTAPIIYQHLDDGEAVANFATNRGTGGDFSITGTLDTGSTSPSD